MISIRIFNDAMNVLYPPRCPICECVMTTLDSGTCRNCLSKLPVIRGARCLKCSKHIDDGELYCSDCRKRKFLYKQGFALWHYNTAARNAVAGLKYKRRKYYADFLSAEMSYHFAKHIKSWKIDALMPVPLYVGKLRHRGFNQAELLADGMGKILGIPVRNDILIRCRNTKPQKYLDDKGRAANLENAFIINKRSKTKPAYSLINVALIDDVYTTGSTIEACAKVLINEGIPNIYFLSLCIGDGY